MSYCSECAHEMVAREAFGRMRPVCPRCGHVAFRDPKVTAGALVVRDGNILMTRRAHDPGRGLWDLPAGYMNGTSVSKTQPSARRAKRPGCWCAWVRSSASIPPAAVSW